MHELDSADSVDGLYTAGPPRTVIGRHYLNAIGREMIHLIQEAAITLRASGALDAAEDYEGQLTQAVHRLVNSDEEFTIEMDDSDIVFTVPRDQHNFQITEDEDGPYPDGSVAFHTGAPEDAVDINRRVWVRNATESRKYVVTGDWTTCIPPGGIALFMAHDSDGFPRWKPLDSRNDKEVMISSESNIYEGSGLATPSPNFEIWALVDARTKKTTARFPASATVPTSATGFFSRLLIWDLSATTSMHPMTDGRRIPLMLSNDAGMELGYMVYNHSILTWEIRKADGTDFTSASTTTVYFPELSFIHR